MLVQIVTENGQKKVIPLTADAGAGNPVGTVIVICSNQIPSNYLPLGTQFDTSLYPVLYALLGTDTTPTASALGLPTLSSGQYAIKATSGLSENAQDNVINTLNEERSYSTTEHLTGRKWIDGKPTYEKTIAEDVTQSDSWDLSTLNIADIIEIKGLAYGTNDQYIGWFPINGATLTSQSSSNTNFVRLLLTHNHNLVLQVYGAGSGATQLNVTKVRITLEYTKTTD